MPVSWAEENVSKSVSETMREKNAQHVPTSQLHGENVCACVRVCVCVCLCVCEREVPDRLCIVFRCGGAVLWRTNGGPWTTMAGEGEPCSRKIEQFGPTCFVSASGGHWHGCVESNIHMR